MRKLCALIISFGWRNAACQVASARRLSGGLASLCAVFGFAVVLLSQGTLPAAATDGPPSLRLGVSRRMFDNVNENDGRAALKVHATRIGDAGGVRVDVNRGLFDDVTALREALVASEVDVVGMPIDDFVTMPEDKIAPELIVSVSDGRVEDEYILVVRADSGIDRITGLQGKRCSVQQNVKGPLALLWLDLLTLRDGLGSAGSAFGSLKTVVKPSQAVLPVFFRQTEAAVTTRKSLKLMAELNPGVARELRVIAESPSVISAVMCFRRGVPQSVIDPMVAGVKAIHQSVAGRQVLTLFQIDRLDVLPLSCADSARALVAEHSRLLIGAAAHPPINSPDRRVP